MVSKNVFYTLLYVSCTALGMYRPAQRPSSTINTRPAHTITQKTAPGKQLTYLLELGKFEAELNKEVDSAADYHTAYEHIKKIIDQNPILSPKDKNELLEEMDKKLTDKFFPKKIAPQRLPSRK